MPVSGAGDSATCFVAVSYLSNERSDGNERRPIALDGVSGRPSSYRTMSLPRASRARWIVGPELARSIWTPLTGKRTVWVTCRGRRMTRCASRCSTFTNAFIRLSSENSCADAAHPRAAAPSRSAMTIPWRRVMDVTSQQNRRTAGSGVAPDRPVITAQPRG